MSCENCHFSWQLLRQTAQYANPTSRGVFLRLTGAKVRDSLARLFARLSSRVNRLEAASLAWCPVIILAILLSTVHHQCVRPNLPLFPLLLLYVPQDALQLGILLSQLLSLLLLLSTPLRL